MSIFRILIIFFAELYDKVERRILHHHRCLEPAALATLIMLNVADQVGQFFIIIIFV